MKILRVIALVLVFALCATALTGCVSEGAKSPEALVKKAVDAVFEINAEEVINCLPPQMAGIYRVGLEMASGMMGMSPQQALEEEVAKYLQAIASGYDLDTLTTADIEAEVFVISKEQHETSATVHALVVYEIDGKNDYEENYFITSCINNKWYLENILTYEPYGYSPTKVKISEEKLNEMVSGYQANSIKSKPTNQLVSQNGYIYGYQLEYDKSSDLYNKRVKYTREAEIAFNDPRVTVNMKQMWFELNLGMNEVPTFLFEEYNDYWWWNKSTQIARSWFVFSQDVTGNLWDVFVNTCGNVAAGYDWVMTSTAMNNHDGLANSDIMAMAKVIVESWLVEIDRGVFMVSDPDLLEKIDECEKKLNELDASDTPEKVAGVIKIVISTLSEYPKLNKVVEICSGILGDILDTGKASIDAIKQEIFIELESYKGEMIKDLLMQLALTEGLEKDLEAAVYDMIENMTNIWQKNIKKLGNDINKIAGLAVGAVVGGELAKATCGLSIALQASYNGLINTSIQMLTGASSDAWNRYLTETDKYTGTLEGGVNVFLKRTKPQLIEALELYQSNPTLENYHKLNNSNYSGKLQMWALQSKQLSRLFYTILGLGSNGDENAYAGYLQNEHKVIFDYQWQVTGGEWGLWAPNE